MTNYFNLNYEFDAAQVLQSVSERLSRPGSDYICVADGVVLNTANRNPDYMNAVNGGMFSLCDSSYVPLYIKWIYGRRVSQYSGSQIFQDIVKSRRYRMIFLGAQQPVLDGLKHTISQWNPDVETMTFYELPFRDVDGFDYPAIARMIEQDGADIVWVALGAPKQEYFLRKLKPHLSRGVMISVGAVFKFFSGVDVARAPQWMVRHHLEFVYRIYREPRKQICRCAWIITTLPGLLLGEVRRSRSASSRSN